MTTHEQIKASEYVFYQDEEIVMVMDYDPISIGHALIMPQKSYLDIDDLPPKTLKRIFSAAQVYLKLLQNRFPSKGYSIMQNGGAFNEIEVFHLHVFPRFSKEEFEYKSIAVTEEVEVQKMLILLKQEIEKTL